MLIPLVDFEEEGWVKYEIKKETWEVRETWYDTSTTFVCTECGCVVVWTFHKEHDRHHNKGDQSGSQGNV